MSRGEFYGYSQLAASVSIGHKMPVWAAGATAAAFKRADHRGFDLRAELHALNLPAADRRPVLEEGIHVFLIDPKDFIPSVKLVVHRYKGKLFRNTSTLTGVARCRGLVSFNAIFIIQH